MTILTTVAPEPETDVWRPRVVAWETTRRCPLACQHCRAEAVPVDAASNELGTAAGLALIDDLAVAGTRLLILTGGEPMLRDDLFELISHARARGLRVAVAVCGALIDATTAAAFNAAGVMSVSVSIDAADVAGHDGFRGREGAFELACAAVRTLVAAGVTVQVNTVVHRGNAEDLPAIDRLAADLGAAAWDLFALVPTGRASGLASAALAPEGYETVLRWAARRAASGRPTLRVTCAPRFAPLAARQGVAGRGCLGGRSFAFVGAEGGVQTCGFLPLPAGDVRERSFGEIWRESRLFAELRDRDRLRGACGSCAHREVCGGCRARAHAAGDHLGPDPGCILAARGVVS